MRLHLTCVAVLNVASSQYGLAQCDSGECDASLNVSMINVDILNVATSSTTTLALPPPLGSNRGVLN